MAEEVTESLDCPPSTGGILAVLKYVLHHDIVSLTIRPGLDMSVSWLRRAVGEELVTLQPTSIKRVVEEVELEILEGSTSGEARGMLMEAFISLTHQGLAANILLVESITWFKEQMNIPKHSHIPKFGPERRIRFAGLPVYEMDEEFAGSGRIIILAASHRSDEAEHTDFGLILET